MLFSWLGASGRLHERSPVLIVYLDLESYRELGEDPLQGLSRLHYARLLDRMRRAGAKCVVFDIVFSEAKSGPGDESFARALNAYGAAILAGELEVSSRRDGAGEWGRLTRVVEPLPIFQTNAAGWGLAEVAVEEDLTVRRFFPGSSVGGEFVPGISVLGARFLQGPTEREIPRGDQERWLRYYGPPFSIPHLNLAQALDAGATSDDLFRDRVILVGARPMAGGFPDRRDEFRSPYRGWRGRDPFMPGVEVHATQVLNLIQNDWLTRWSWRVEGIVLAVIGVLVAGVLMSLKPSHAILAALGMVAMVGLLLGCGLLRMGLWFPWWVIAFVQLPIATLASFLAHWADGYRQRQRMNAVIREQAALIDKASDAIIVEDLDGRITLANPSARRMLGIDEGLEKISPGSLLGCESSAPRQRAVEFGESEAELNVLVGGVKKCFSTRWTLLKEPNGRPDGLLVIASDVTEKKQLEREAGRMQRMNALGSLAGGMAHDLNNALSPVLMGAQLLRRHQLPDDQGRIVSLMEGGASRGIEMVRQVLRYLRGQVESQSEIDLRRLFKEMEALIRDMFPKDIRLNIFVAPEVASFRGDFTQVHQLMMNLVINARDAMPDGGEITIEAENIGVESGGVPPGFGAMPGRYVLTTVTDTGCGMPEEVLRQLFEPFFTTKEPGKGTGLGLSTAKRIIEAHGGFIRVSSTPGVGTSFEVFFPAASPAAKNAGAPEGGPQIALIAEDQAVETLLTPVLRERGHRVLVVRTARELVEHPGRSLVWLVLDGSRSPACAGSLQDLAGRTPGLRVLRLDAASTTFPGGQRADAGLAGVLDAIDGIAREADGYRTAGGFREGAGPG